MAYYIILHHTKSSYLGKSGWTTSLSFVRRFDSFVDAHDFCVRRSLYDQNVIVARVADEGYGPEITEVVD